MKTKSFFIVASLFLSMTLSAQLPNPLNFNTATNVGNTGVITLGNPDLHWTSSQAFAGPYTAYPVRCNTASGWVTSPYNNADWITYPHTCNSSDPSEHHALGDVDEFYKINFQLPTSVCGNPITNPNSYCLVIDFYADNCVYEIFVNGISSYVNPNFVPVYNNNNSFKAGYQSSVSLCSNWIAGTNNIIVHVKSGAPNDPGYTGFLAVVNQAATTSGTGCEDPLPTSCCIGNSCGNTSNPLLANYEIPMNLNNYYFSGDAANSDKVNIGLTCNTIFPGKLNVSTALPSNQQNGDSYSIYGTNTNVQNGTTNTGVFGSAIASSGEVGANHERGVWGYANGGIDATGVFGQAGSAFNSYGGYFESISFNGTGTNFGLYSKATNGATNWAGYFDGNVIINGTGWINTNLITSDKRYKRDISPLENASEKLLKLNGYTYKFKVEEFAKKGFDSTSQIGLIAQEVKEIFPQLVKENSDGYLAVNYQALIPVLIEGFKQQQQQLNELKSFIQTMTGNTLDKKSNSFNSISVDLSDKNTIVLNQNVPNPFAESTVISYNIPTDFVKAQILFFTTEGKIIKTVDLSSKGKGNLTVFANDLSNGIYSYSLVIDGKTIDSKKMIKE